MISKRAADLSVRERFFNSELIKTEKRRLDVFIAFLIVASVVAVIFQVEHLDILRDTFTNPASYPLIMFFAFVMMGLFFLGKKYVIWIEKKGLKLSRWYFYYTVLMEVALPSIWLVMESSMEKTSIFLDSPITFIYFVLIIVSSLHLDFWISVLMGILVSIFISWYTLWVTDAYPIQFHLPLVVYQIRSFMFLMAGICAGFVAHELKKRMRSTYDQIQEKENIEGLFNQQISKEMVGVLKQESDYTAKMEVTVMFLDIRDFTQRVQHLSPDEVNKFQNAFFAPVIEIINNSKGTVNQIMGDGIMATFGAPVTDRTHYFCAWMAVKNILAFLEEFKKDYPQYESIDIGLGLHCGEVFIGNIGTESRKQLSVSGTPVIIASRIEQLNKDLNTRVLVSRVFFDLIKEEVQDFKAIGHVKMKGLDEEIEVVQVF